MYTEFNSLTPRYKITWKGLGCSQDQSIDQSIIVSINVLWMQLIIVSVNVPWMQSPLDIK